MQFFDPESRGALLGQFDRSALEGLLAGISLVDKEQPSRMPSQVSWRPAGDDLERSSGEATGENRVAIRFAGLDLQGVTQHRRRAKRGLEIADRKIAGVGFGGQHDKHLRRIIGDVAADRRGDQSRKANATRFDEGDALDLRIDIVSAISR